MYADKSIFLDRIDGESEKEEEKKIETRKNENENKRMINYRGKRGRRHATEPCHAIEVLLCDLCINWPERYRITRHFSVYFRFSSF